MNRTEGFVLIAALWLLTAVSVVMLAFGLGARAHRRAAVNAVEMTRARLAADAGLISARAALAARLRAAERAVGSTPADAVVDPWSDLGEIVPEETTVGRAVLRVTLRDCGARLNLNRAGEDELRTLLAALGVDYGESDRIAQAISDWSDADDFPRARGAERDDYLESGALGLPSNRAFERLSELRGVRGVTPELFARISPHLTLLGDGRVNLNSAERAVLLTLPGFSVEAAATLDRLRRSGRRIASIYDLALHLSPSARAALLERLPELVLRATVETTAVEVVSVATTPAGGARATVEALVVRGGGAAQLVWRRG